MPRRTPADLDLIQKTYEETGSGRETARRLGLHDNTIYAALRRLRGKCLTCRNLAKAGNKYCPECLDKLSERQAMKRREKKRLGICNQCNEQVDYPLSRTMCQKHRLAAYDEASAQATNRAERRRGSHQGTPTMARRINHIKNNYGETGVAAWRRDEMSCIICRAKFGEKVLHLHHINLNGTDHRMENFATLCFDCHKAIHTFLINTAPEQLIAWMIMNYPEFKNRFHA